MNTSIDQRMPSHVTAMAARVSRRCWRFAGSLMTAEDMAQIALLAAWESRERWQQMEAEHLAPYLSRRMTGAVIDTVRTALGRRNKGHLQIFFVSGDDDEHAETAAASDDPIAELAVAQAIRAIEALRPPLPFIARRCLEQCDLQDIAIELGVSPSRISQHMRTLRRVCTKYLSEPINVFSWSAVR